MSQKLASYVAIPEWSPNPFSPRTVLWFCFGSFLLSSRSIPGSYWRVILLRLFGAKIGSGCRIKPGFRVKSPWRLNVGSSCWLGEDVWIDNLAPVSIGDSVCISQGAYLCTGNHDYRSPNFDLLVGPIVVESEVWIAAQAVLAPGTRICETAVVGIGSVVSGLIPKGAVVRGNPSVRVGWR